MAQCLPLLTRSSDPKDRHATRNESQIRIAIDQTRRSLPS